MAGYRTSHKGNSTRRPGATRSARELNARLTISARVPSLGAAAAASAAPPATSLRFRSGAAGRSSDMIVVVAAAPSSSTFALVFHLGSVLCHSTFPPLCDAARSFISVRRYDLPMVVSSFCLRSGDLLLMIFLRWRSKLSLLFPMNLPNADSLSRPIRSSGASLLFTLSLFWSTFLNVDQCGYYSSDLAKSSLVFIFARKMNCIICVHIHADFW